MPLGIIPVYAGIGNLPKTNKHNAGYMLNHYVIFIVHLGLVTDIVSLRDIYFNPNVLQLLIT